MSDIRYHEDYDRNSNITSTLTRCACDEYTWLCLVITAGFGGIIAAGMCLMFVEREACNFSGRNRPHSLRGKKSSIFSCLEMRKRKMTSTGPAHKPASIEYHPKGNAGRSMVKPLLAHLIIFALLSLPLVSRGTRTHAPYLHGYDISSAWHLKTTAKNWWQMV